MLHVRTEVPDLHIMAMKTTDNHSRTERTCQYVKSLYTILLVLKGTKTEKLHAMHVKELIKTNYSEW